MSTLVIRYKCSYCNKETKTSRGITRHERLHCWHRPEHKTCFTCGLFIDKEHQYPFPVVEKHVFYKEPACADKHDVEEEASDGYNYTLSKPWRRFDCEFYEPREDHPGEYVQFRTGCGGYRKAYIDKVEQEGDEK